MTPACAQACPTESIQYGALDELRERAAARVATLHERGVPEARLYGHDPDDGVGGDGAFFLLLDEPEVYGLPPDPVVTTRDLPAMWKRAGLAALAMAAAAAVAAVPDGGAADDGAGRAAVATASGGERAGRAGGRRSPPTTAGRSSRRRCGSTTSPAYLFTGGLAAGSSLLGRRRRPDRPAGAAPRRAGRPRSAALGASTVLPGQRPGPAGAVPPHAAGGQADLADVGGHLDPHRVRPGGRRWPRSPSSRRCCRGRRARARPSGRCRRSGSVAGLAAAGHRAGAGHVHRRCCSPTPRCRPGTRPTRSCRSSSPAARWPAASGVGLIAAPAAQAGPARRLAVAGAALELGGGHQLETGMGLLSEPYRHGRSGRLLRRAAPCSPWVPPARCSAGAAGSCRRCPAPPLLAASVATRFGVFEAGVASARDPQYTVVPQRERLDQKVGTAALSADRRNGRRPCEGAPSVVMQRGLAATAAAGQPVNSFAAVIAVWTMP